MVKQFPKDRFLSEDEWRGLGIQQSQGWVHYMCHKPGMSSDFNNYIPNFVHVVLLV